MQPEETELREHLRANDAPSECHDDYFVDLFLRMQSPKHREACEALFDASEDDLNSIYIGT